MFFRLLGRTLFVLVFIVTGYEKLTHPSHFTGIYSKRYQEFESFTSSKGIVLPQILSSKNVVKNMDLINKYMAYELIVVGLLIVAHIPYIPVFLSLHILIFTVVVNNPLYHTFESREFYKELGQVILSLGLFGISLLFWGRCCNKNNVCVTKTSKKKHKKTDESEEEKKPQKSPKKKRSKGKRD